MKTIEKKITDYCKASLYDSRITDRKTFSVRDYVEVTEKEINYYLWSSKIVSIDKKTKNMCFSFCGYMTNTTKARINAFLSALGKGHSFQKNYKIYWTDGKLKVLIDTEKRYFIKEGLLTIEFVSE